jgi:hypothetical protein
MLNPQSLWSLRAPLRVSLCGEEEPFVIVLNVMLQRVTEFQA